MSILVGYVNRPEGKAAVEVAIAEAERRGRKLVVVHSMEGGKHETSDDYTRAAVELEELEKRLEASGVPYELHELVRGNTVGEDISEAVAEFDAELVVIGIRRRSRLGKMLLGSNATDILFDAPCPVLVVKAAEEH